MTTATATRLFDNIIEFSSLTQEKQRSNEWYTPARYIEAAREVMGGIDLDPASCARANETVRATRYYSKEDDGLSKEWRGRIWLNPPYSLSDKQDSCGLFVSSTAAFSNKLIHEYEVGNVTQAILLVVSQTHSRWFKPMWKHPICFTDHRIKFHGKKYNPKTALTHMFGSVFVYLGPNEARFIEVFSQFGRIAKAIDTPHQTVVPLSLWDEVLS